LHYLDTLTAKCHLTTALSGSKKVQRKGKKQKPSVKRKTLYNEQSCLGVRNANYDWKVK